MLIGSPTRTAFSTCMALNAARSSDPAAIKRAKRQAIQHIDVVISLYYEQLGGGRYFSFGHPMFAISWRLLQVKNLIGTAGVQRVRGDQCQQRSSEELPRASRS